MKLSEEEKMKIDSQSPSQNLEKHKSEISDSNILQAATQLNDLAVNDNNKDKEGVNEIIDYIGDTPKYQILICDSMGELTQEKMDKINKVITVSETRPFNGYTVLILPSLESENKMMEYLPKLCAIGIVVSQCKDSLNP
jgi:hypothetical protein